MAELFRHDLQGDAGRTSDTVQIDPNILAELRSWGLVMPRTLELTGTGGRYAGAEKRLP